MTGSGAQYGEEVRKGIELALDEINSDGGIKGVPMRLILEDSATEAKTALSAFEKMTTNRQIQVIVTEVSGVVLALAPKVNEKKIILFNVGAQHPEVRECGPYVFSNIDDATVESKALAEFAFNRLKAKKAAVLYTNVAYGEGARAVFSDTFQKIGGTIVAEVPFNEDGLDYRAQIGEVQKASPEVVYLPGHTKDMAKVLKQSYEIGFKPQWLSYTPFEGPDVLTIAGAAAEGVIYSSLSLDYDNAPPITKRFFDKFKNKYTVAPGTYSATGYDAAILVANAVKSVGNDATKIREYFLSMPEFQGVSGPTKFLPNGAVEKPLIFKTVRNGRFEILDK
jgi:branched-chain amino acid transport system substrate-binding protein